jgi:ATP-binding cassette subfamily B protein
MDCGPASLKAILGGFGIHVRYGRLREACQTDVDGTSIDTMEDIAVELGLDAVQIMVPADHLFLPEAEALPAIVVIRQPNGLTHFVVVWRVHGNVVQVMDPATGRGWRTRKRLLNDLYLHAMPVNEDFAYEWITAEDFINPLCSRLSELELRDKLIDELIETATNSSGWQSPAALDAATRLTAALVRTEGIRPGKEAERVLTHFFRKASDVPLNEAYAVIPASYWSFRLSPDENRLYLYGAVLMNAAGLYQPESPEDVSQAEAGEEAEEAFEEEAPALSPELSAALREPETGPGKEIFRAVMADGAFVLVILLATLVLATLGVTLEALLLKGLLDISEFLPQLATGQRAGIAVYLYAFFIILLLLECSGAASLLYIGRWLEIRLRVAILKKIPRLGDRYFHSRLTSDMAQRAHELRQLRGLPDLASKCFRTSFELILTTAGIIWLNPSGAGLAILTVGVILGMSFLSQPLLKEQDLCFRTHIGALSRFYLDALLGLIPIRTHRAERSVQTEHESLLGKWWDAGMSFYRSHLMIWGTELLITTGFSILILFNYVENGGEASGVLLLLYWVMKLPILGESLATTLQQYPMQHNRVLRLLEMLNSREESEIWYGEQADQEPADVSEDRGVAITMDAVSVQAGGHLILRDIDLEISPGEHIAVVGPSGAGKSSLAGLLLGWHRPATGTVRADTELLHGDRLYRLRRETAWVDPAVQIWNRSLTENLCYGYNEEDLRGFDLSYDWLEGLVIQQTNLSEILGKLPQGVETRLGEGGGLVSGGEGQRVRLGRAFMRPNARLVILDEPFRGLDRKQRQELLKRSRNHWKDATLIFVSHDISESMAFDRVLVMADGQIVEDDAPDSLMAKPDSRYRALLASEDAVRRTLWEGADWRRWDLDKGKLNEVIKKA